MKFYSDARTKVKGELIKHLVSKYLVLGLRGFISFKAVYFKISTFTLKSLNRIKNIALMLYLPRYRGFSFAENRVSNHTIGSKFKCQKCKNIKFQTDQEYEIIFKNMHYLPRYRSFSVLINSL